MITKKAFYKALLEELKKFEKKFGHYMSGLLGEDYVMVRDRHLNIILKSLGDDVNPKILSFNYSSIDSKKYNSKYDVSYVHGTTSNPIFGISSENDESPLISFDKVSRRRELHSGLPTYETILNKNEDNHYNLVFFGLSFAKSDLEDYKIIFDYLGKADKIYILYPDYGHERREDEVHTNFMKLYQTIVDPEKKIKIKTLEEKAPLVFIPIKF